MRPLAPFVLVLALSACDSTEIRPGVFDPFDTSRAYSVYAVLDATDTDHTIRVQTVRRESDPPLTQAEALSQAPRVVTVDGATGDSLVWARSAERLSDGTYAAFYTARYEPSALRTVELFLTRPDGTNAYGQATVPNGEAMPVLVGPVETEDGVLVSTRWDQFGALRLATGTVAYRLDPGDTLPTILPFDVEVDLAPGAEPVVTANLSDVAQAIRSQRGLGADEPIYLYGIDVAVEGTSPGWTSAGGDPVLAAEAGNIDGAVGRFGFVDEGKGSVLPSEDWIVRAGFTPAP